MSESMVEEAAVDWFGALGYSVESGPDMSAGTASSRYPVRGTHAEVLLASTVHGALRRLNPELPDEALVDALRTLGGPEGGTLEARNRAFHFMLVDGVAVEYPAADGPIRGAQARVIDFDDPDANTWSAIKQFTVVEGRQGPRARHRGVRQRTAAGLHRAQESGRRDGDRLVGVPAVEAYKAELPSLFACNLVLAMSDGMQARLGTVSSGREWFKPWHTIDGQELAPAFDAELQVAIERVFEMRRFLSLLRDFMVFEDDGGALVTNMAGYHQFHAVEAAVRETLRAAALQQEAQRVAEPGGRYEAGRQPGGDRGDRRIDVVWHTQGSGKSLTMPFYAGRIVRERVMANPTVVVLTDRNGLYDRLFGTFARCHDLLHQPPVRAASRADLRAKSAVEAGGVVFTAIQTFLPEEKDDRAPLLYDRRNIVVIADEAHRSQYDFLDGYARHIRDASFIGFTGTPIELQDANTRAVFGDYISVYDIQRAVEDHATVPIYYESRLAKLTLDEREWRKAVLRPTHPSDREIVWCATTSGAAIDRLAQLADGGAYPAVHPIAVLYTLVALPNARIRLAFSSYVAPMLNRFQANQREARSLGALRDALGGSVGSPRGAAGVSDR